MILKLRDDSLYEEGWLYVDNVHSTKVECTTFAFTKDRASADEDSPRHVHDTFENDSYKLGIYQIGVEEKVINDGSDGDVAIGSFCSVPNREVEFRGGKILCDWRRLIKHYEKGSNDHIGIKMITAVFDTKEGKESETYIVQKGQEVYLLSDTGKTIERI